MFFDARTVSENTTLDADICIIGGGAAGITMALELADTGVRVIVLESGDRFWDDDIQSLYAGDNVGVQGWELDESRLRFLGGSTNHWAGNCMRLEDIDFEARPGIAHSGWPITRSDLDPFYTRAQTYVEIPDDGPFDTPERIADLGLDTFDLDETRLRTFLYAESPPTAFGAVYEDALTQAGNVAVYLHATALEVETDDTAQTVTGVRASSIGGPEFGVRATHYVLAAGGIEIPRLLFLSNRVAPAGLGNANDLVGRFFMDHLSVRPALRVMNDTDEGTLSLYLDQHQVDGGYVRGGIAASQDLIRREELPHFLFFLFDNDNRSPGQVAAEVLKRGAGQGELPPSLLMHLGNVLTDMDGVTNEIYRTITDSRDDLIRRRWIDPWLTLESLPNPDSRLTLTDTRDPHFGQQRLQLDWQLLDADLQGYIRATEILAMEFGRLGFGRVWSDLLHTKEWPRIVHHGKHHCGTTRMSDDPATGVVDADCRVHGMSNLFIASSSVFPTHGYATPTLTIVALSVRLADHLKDRLARGENQ